MLELSPAELSYQADDLRATAGALERAAGDLGRHTGELARLRVRPADVGDTRLAQALNRFFSRWEEVLPATIGFSERMAEGLRQSATEIEQADTAIAEGFHPRDLPDTSPGAGREDWVDWRATPGLPGAGAGDGRSPWT